MRPAATPDLFDASSRGLRHEGLRRANQKAVLRAIGFNPGASAAEIARLCGLAPQTVSAILGALEEHGLIERGEVLRGRRGQPATPIQLRASGAFSIGAEVSWNHTQLVLLNLHGQVLAEKRIAHDVPDALELPRAIGAAALDLAEALEAGERQRLHDIGIAMPGRLAEHLDLVGATPDQAQRWREVDLAAELAERTGLSASMLNDGNAACWAELIALERPRPPNILYFLISHFIAAGVVANGDLWEGLSGNAANLGSMLVPTEDGTAVIAHDLASISALERRLVEAGLALADVGNGAADTVLETWIAESAAVLARVVFNATTVIESPLIVLDTALDAAIRERLADALSAELARLPVRGFAPPPVVRGHFGRLAPAIGAAELPLFRRHF